MKVDLQNSFLKQFTGKRVISLFGIQRSRRGKHDGGVEVADNARHGVGSVFQRVRALIGGI